EGTASAAGDRVQEPHGRDRHRARCTRQPHVHDGPWRFGVLLRTRWLGASCAAVRPGEPLRNRLPSRLIHHPLIPLSHPAPRTNLTSPAMSYDKPIRRVAIVGTGVIGASWAAQYLARGLDVIATDPAPNAEANLRKYVDEAWADLEAIGLSPGA